MTRRALIPTVFLALLLLFSGCGDGGAEAETAVSPETTAPEVFALPPFADEAGVNFRVIRAEEATEDEIDAAVMIVKAITEATGKIPDMATDFIKRDVAYDSSTYEILVGRTGYPESKTVLSTLSFGEYTVRAEGNKIVVAAWSDGALRLAAGDFADKIKGGMTAFRTEDGFTGTYNAMLSVLPAYTDGSFAAIDNAGNKAYQVVVEQTTAEAWTAWCETLTKAEFTADSIREAAGNRFAIYRGAKYGVTTYFTPFNKTARIIVEPLANLGPAGDDTGAPAITTPKLTMIGRRFSQGNTYRGAAADTGYMCYVLRLADGRFIVIDGGTGIDAFVDGIYTTLRDQAPDPTKIEVAAWIVTHSHGDHNGAFINFCGKYKNAVNISMLMTNLPAESVAENAKDSGGKTAVNRTFTAFTEAFPKGQVVKVHNGYSRTIGGAQIEVLYTHEDYITSARMLANTKLWNNTSLIFRVSIAGQVLMFLGDSQVDSNTITSNMYGNYLKSDIVQVAHHGGEGGTAQIYTLIDAATALFTTSDELMPIYLADAHNAHLVGKTNLKEWINAADRITCFDLPYTVGKAQIKGE